MSEIERTKVAANVVTYNRKQLLGECLGALLSQTYPLDAIYIIDNVSTDGTPEYLMDKGLIDNILCSDKEPLEAIKVIPLPLFPDKTVEIHYVRMHENTGSSGGQYEGIKRGFEKGFDWLWLMDDDGSPDIHCLKNLLEYKNKGDFLAPLVICEEGKEELSFGIYDINASKTLYNLKEINNEIYLNTASPFNGVLISNILIDGIGYPKKEMFIWGDEEEYMARALKNGFKILTITKAKHYHPKGKVEKYKLFNWYWISWQKNELKNYCDIRNHTYLKKKYGNSVNVSWFFLKYTLFLLFFKKSIRDYLRFTTAFTDGYMEKWGGERKFLEK